MAAKIQPTVHDDWYPDGIEDGCDLWRLDLPGDIQIQASIDVADLEDELDGEPPEYGKDAVIFIEHDVRGAGPGGDERTKYSCDDFKWSRDELFTILSMCAGDAERKLHLEIEHVKAMPSDPAMCEPPDERLKKLKKVAQQPKAKLEEAAPLLLCAAKNAYTQLMLISSVNSTRAIRKGEAEHDATLRMLRDAITRAEGVAP